MKKVRSAFLFLFLVSLQGFSQGSPVTPPVYKPGTTKLSSLVDIMKTTQVLLILERAAQYCFTHELAVIHRLRNQVEVSFLDFFEQVPSADAFQTEEGVHTAFQVVDQKYDQALFVLSAFLRELEVCRQQFVFAQGYFQHRSPTSVGMEADLEKISNTRRYVGSVLERLDELRVQAVQFYNFLKSDWYQNRKKAALRYAYQFQVKKIHGELVEGASYYDRLPVIIERSLAFKNAIEDFAYELHYAYDCNHIVFISDFLPEFERLIVNADEFLGTLSPEEKTITQPSILIKFVENAQGLVAFYKRALEVFQKIPLENIAVYVAYETKNQFKGVQAALADNDSVTRVLQDELRGLEIQAEQAPDPRVKLRLYYELDLALRRLKRLWL